jgi:hypothetical protein
MCTVSPSGLRDHRGVSPSELVYKGSYHSCSLVLQLFLSSIEQSSLILLPVSLSRCLGDCVRIPPNTKLLHCLREQ